MAETNPLNIFANLPRVPSTKDATLADVLGWARDHSRVVSTLFRRLQTAIPSAITAGVGKHASTHKPQTGADPLLTASHTGGYGTSVLPGTGDNLLRSDARLLFPSALSPLADATKTLTLTSDGVDQTLTGTLGRLILAPVSSVDVLNALIVAKTQAKMSTFGDTVTASQAGAAQSDANDRLYSIMHSTTPAAGNPQRAILAVDQWDGSAASSAKIMGFNAFAVHAGAGALTQTALGGGLIAGRMGVRLATPGTGTVSLFSGLAIANQASGPTVTATEGIGLNVEGLSMAGVTFTTQYSAARIACPTTAVALPLVHGLLIDNIPFGTLRYGIKSSNKIVNIATDIGTEAAGKGFYMLDGVDGHFYRLSTQNGILMLTDLGVTAPAS